MFNVKRVTGESLHSSFCQRYYRSLMEVHNTVMFLFRPAFIAYQVNGIQWGTDIHVSQLYYYLFVFEFAHVALSSLGQ